MAAFEVSVRGRGANFIAHQLVGVHTEAHRASGLPPVETRFPEDLIDAHFRTDFADALGTRDSDGANSGGHLAALEEFGSFHEVGDAGVGARAEEGNLDLLTGQSLPGFKLHEFQCLLGGGAVGFGQLFRGGDGFIDENTLSRIDAPSDGGADFGSLEDLHVVVHGIGVGGHLPPLRDGGVPILAFGAVGAAFQVFEGFFVWVDVTDSGAALDRHVADGHALFNGEAFDRWAGILVGVASSTVDPKGTDDVEDNIFCVDAGAKFAPDLDLADFEGRERHGLGGQDVSNLAGADAESDRTESTVGGGMGISASDGGAGLGDALFWTHNVDDALLAGWNVEEGDTEFGAVFAEFLDHGVSQRILEGFDSLIGRNNMVDRGKGAIGEGDLQA